MTNLNQQILKFDYEQNFKDQDFYVSNSNQYSFNLLNSWPKWEKNFINLIGEKFSGKSHLISIFLEKYKGIKLNSEDINNDFLRQIKIYENIVVEDLTEKIDEKFKEMIVSKIPSARLGEPEDVANAVVFLASNQSDYINGETLHVNGGMYMA